MDKVKRNVITGVATGVLVGFVLGAVFGKPDSSFSTSDTRNAKGNVMSISRFGNSASVTEQPEAQPSDSLKLTATDENGKEMIIIIKEK